MAESDRRTGHRVAVQMWVEEESADGLYFQRSANLSEGGMFLEKTIPHPVGTQIALQFTLPDNHGPLKVRGEIVNAAAEEGELGMGVKFVGLPDDVAERIRQFIRGRAP
jgi:type IV pilus assembly protein PilZ